MLNMINLNIDYHFSIRTFFFSNFELNILNKLIILFF